MSKADAKEQYFENEIIESIATLNDADSSSFINKYARDIEDAYFSNNIPINDEQEEVLKADIQINNDQVWFNHYQLSAIISMYKKYNKTILGKMVRRRFRRKQRTIQTNQERQGNLCT